MPGQFLGALVRLAHGGVEDDFALIDAFAVVVDHLEGFGADGNGQGFAGSVRHAHTLERYQARIQRRVLAALVLAVNLHHVVGADLSIVAHDHVHQALPVLPLRRRALHVHVAVGEAIAEGIEGLAR